MKIFVTGVGGQLGHDVMNELAKRGIEGIGSDVAQTYSGVQDGSAVCTMAYHQLDITDKDAVNAALHEARPDAVIHCAAWTAVDLAEDDDKIEKVRAVNAEGTRYIAEVCKELDCPMMYISTDYVFDGQGTKPWEPDCRDYKPMNVYGQTKLEGELAVSGILDKYFIVRIAWVFGRNGNNFIKTMINLGKTHDTLRVVSDQIGTPTYTYDLARLLVDMIQTEKYGYYHATNEGGYISWYEFACAIFEEAGMNTRVIPVTTEEYGLSKAARPFNSRLEKSKLRETGFTPLPDWRDALKRYIEVLREDEE
ncbi:dTDP-4-dehydrorhamnose reductase [Waltera intestinalis]|uniref:dTDP-4-dehydrorhamnose reductase n=1 Tax=Waltera intestinalis TaxID=2606635 RepID=A0A6L5YKK7_9FIRM|nr:dTDP-4-dehydrorhamnose reductase [Waltera intestinalis]MST58518.1 dTDP-4-dehydrorhamnose reductase [Waltera intestinalis]